jgi:hypothetical protein
LVIPGRLRNYLNSAKELRMNLGNYATVPELVLTWDS